MIFIAGPHSAGKTTIAKQLQNCGFLHIETGDIVRKIYREEAPGIEFHAWASSQHQRFNRFMTDAVLDARLRVEQSQGIFQDIIVTGNRQIGGIDYLRQQVPLLDGCQNLILYVEADEQTLFRRHIGRPERCDGELTFEEFKKKVLDFDSRMGLEKIRGRANLIVCNEGEIDWCVDCVIKFFETSGYLLAGRKVEGRFQNPERE